MQLKQFQTIGLIGDANSDLNKFCETYAKEYNIQGSPQYESLKSFASIKTIVNKADLIQSYQIEYEKLNPNDIMDFIIGYGEKLVLFIDIATFDLQPHDNLPQGIGQIAYNNQTLLFQLIQYLEVKELVIVFNKELSVNTKEYFDKQIKSIIEPIQNILKLKPTKFKIVDPFKPSELSEQFTKSTLDIEEILKKELFFYVLAKNKEESLIKIIHGVLSKDLQFYFCTKENPKQILTTKIIVNGEEVQYAYPGDIAIISCTAQKGTVGRAMTSKRPNDQNQISCKFNMHCAILVDQHQQTFEKKSTYLYIGYMNRSQLPSTKYKLKLTDYVQGGKEPLRNDRLQSEEVYRTSFFNKAPFDWFAPDSELNKFVMMDSKDKIHFIAIIKDIDIKYIVQPEQRLFEINKNENQLIQKIEQGQKPQDNKFLVNCHICQMNKINTLLLPCYHYRYCGECADEYKQCLYCDTEVNSRIRLQYVIQQEYKKQNQTNVYKYIQQRSILEGKIVKTSCQQCELPFQTVKQCKQEIHYFCMKCFNTNNCKDCDKDDFKPIVYDFEN